MLLEADITDIYNKHIAINYTKEYVNRYVPLPLQLNNKEWKWEGKDFPRIISLLEFARFIKEYDRTFNSVLSFNGNKDPEYEYLKYKNRYNYSYKDDVDKYDLHNLQLDRSDFDFVMLNQTLEHLYDPISALKNIYKHLSDGAIFYANVPCNSIPHTTPFHYYTGITPSGLGALIKLAGFEILEIGQWGNVEYFKQMFDNKWSDYKHMYKLTDHVGHNDLNCPIITWCWAIK